MDIPGGGRGGDVYDKDYEFGMGVYDKDYEYDKDFMKIKFSSDDNLPLNKTLKLYNMTIIIRSVFEEHGKLYLQVYLDE